MQDEQIIDLYWQRSEEAVRETDAKYGRYCGTIARNILYSPEETEECVNDTWLNAWNAMPPRRPTFLKSFLGKITRNLALNRYESLHAEKRGGGEVALALSELSEVIGQEGADPEDRMVLTECLNRFLSELKEEDRRIFVQRYWYLRQVKEIAEAYGLGESKVKMTLLRQRERLKKALEQEEVIV